MSLIVKDGNGSSQTLATGLSGSELVPFHAVSGSVTVTSTTLTASIANSTSLTASIANSTTLTASIANSTTLTASIANTALTITSSANNPAFITGSVTISSPSILSVTSSQSNPVYVTSNGINPVFVYSTAAIPVFITSSGPLNTKTAGTTTSNRNSFTSYGGTINWAGTGSSNISGTFILAGTSYGRRGVMFANNTNKDLYVAIGDNDLGSTNGFLLTTTASAPAVYSFILYPSGTYFAESAFVGIKHSGFFVSSSNIDVQITVITTE